MPARTNLYFQIFMKRTGLVLSAFGIMLLTNQANSQSDSDIKIDENTFGAIEARHIGPAAMSGRITSLDALQKDPRIIYVGSASGGLWKTTNGGVIFKPVFDKYNQSIGSVTIDQNHPDTVWVGTGETWVRNSTSIGDGIYKTTDGGENWKKMGLDSSERIGKIIIHPDDPNIVYVAVLGHLWNSNEDRGVYKTTDGGTTWEKILYVDENTGCADLDIDLENPEVLYAAMWQFRRYPYYFNSGGPGSGLYISRDGGANWTKTTEGLPSGTLGRIALSVSPVKSNLVFAVIESEKSALYRSDDKGMTWKKMNDTPDMSARPFYFSFLLADPADTNRIYKPGYYLSYSEDGGKTFKATYVVGGNVHSDIHPIWVSKKDNSLMYVGTDGGLYVSSDKGSSWRFIRNLPVSQFYHITVDNKKPYQIYGGLQDNGSWMVPSKSPGGIENRDWTNLGGGDGFYAFPDKYDENLVYWQYQGGNIMRKTLDTRETKEIKPFAKEGEPELRFHWNTPVVFSPTRDAMYVGSQYLYRTTTKGDIWERISPDLTTNNPEKQKQLETGGVTIDNSTAENHCTIYTINESVLDPNVIWAGTDDGNLQITRDGGKSWTNVAPNVSGLPAGTWVSYVSPSRYDRGMCYVTFDGHMTGDMTPYVYKTMDYGQTWVFMSDENIKGFCHVVIEDPVNPELLFLGTESGLFVTIDGGKVWSQFKGNLPNVPVRDLVIQERENDLVIGTHGRGVMIIDDITPLRNLSQEVLHQDVAFLGSRPFELGHLDWEMGFIGDDEFVGSNPPGSTLIHYYLKKRHVFGDMFIEIYNEKGEKIKELPAGKRKGINRVSWPMQMKGPKVPRSPLLSPQAMYGPTYPPGKYTVKIVKGNQVYEGQVSVVYDPAIPHSAADRDKRYETLMKAYNLLEDLAYTDKVATEVRDQSKEMAVKSNKKSLVKKLSGLSESMEVLHKELVATNLTSAITGEEKLREKIGDIYSAVNGYQGRPSQNQTDRLEILSKQVDEKKTGLSTILTIDIPSLNDQLAREKIEAFKLTSKEEFLKED
jgi:photosystem II stability/assembly factor-like uncharacterized protein